MCNEAYREGQIDRLISQFGQLGLSLRFPEGVPNFAPLPGFRITDRVEIVRPAATAPSEAEMVTRRWSWPGPGGKPVYNFRSDGREFRNKADGGRCLIPVDGFFEFTDPPPPAPDEPRPKGKPLKSKWAFTVRGLEGFCIAGLWRADASVGEAWTMLTCSPGPDVAPYHGRQVVVLTPPDYARWLDDATPAAELCRPLPAGTLAVERVR